ncbi:MAG: tRNA (guanosine(46)-N7)-methyltransferase TrmB [Synergistaceae bacterium]|jgi:tRNA (guanine-N7-)-methyltransferase|nr:tRNA (guanosine(46)-N7)-methyltransferase TrmB [Synergistaceae bacterium]
MYWNFTDILKRPGAAPFSRDDGAMRVEIGFGNGEFLERLARSGKDTLAIGIEVSRWCVAKAARRALAGGLENLRLLLGDARFLLKYAFEPSCVSEVYMNFPCPWPKRRHSSRRVASHEFARSVHSSLESGGAFTLATDVEWYANETRDVFASDEYFETGPVRLATERACLTKYERKWREMGRETFLLSVMKIKERPATNMEEDAGMTGKIALLGERHEPAGADELREKLSPLVGETVKVGDYMIVFRELFFSEDGAALLSVISVDEGFEQHFFVRATPSERGYRGKIDPTGCPYKTPGVRAALRCISKTAGVVF